MKPSFVIFWMLLLIPALLVGGIAFYLLRHEEERIQRAEVTAAEDRAQTIIANMQLAIEEVREGLSENLRDIEAPQVIETLQRWERNNPLVRNVFAQKSNGAMLLPSPVDPMTEEEEGFVKRYEPLLAGKEPWTRPTETGLVVASTTPARRTDRMNDAFWTARNSLKQLAYSKYDQQQQTLNASPVQQEAEPEPVATGWRSWFANNRLHMVGWARNPQSGMIYGVDLEMAALFSRLLTFFPSGPDIPEGYALLDGNGGIFYQASPTEITEEAQPLVRVSVGALLPHWQVAVYPAGLGQRSTARFLTLLYTLLIGIFVLAILLGGALLLAQAHRSLRDAQQKTSFVSNVSHELKTPLTTIRMYAELIGEGRVKDEAKQKNYMKVITDESRRLTRLVNNVLDFGRLEQKRKKYHRETLDLQATVGDLVETQRMRVEEAGMQLVLSETDEPVVVKTDRDALEQAVLNLIDNAVKYAPEGERVAVAVRRERAYAAIRVTDQGPGIPESQREKVFDKFHRIDDSLTAKTQGSGLGLTIARRLIRDLDGELVYEPGENGGASFVIRLPLGRDGTDEGRRQERGTA